MDGKVEIEKKKKIATYYIFVTSLFLDIIIIIIDKKL